jgi:uncharacterized protein YecT (DUF1311 family)
MRNTSVITLLLFVYGIAIATPIFDYHKVQSSSQYFSEKSDFEINEMCASQRGLSTTDISFCAKRDFEKSSSTLDKVVSDSFKRIRENDKYLKSIGFPEVFPSFVKSQYYWGKFRDTECYSQYLSSTGSMRYYEFWDCMTNITKSRVKSLDNSDTQK